MKSGYHVEYLKVDDYLPAAGTLWFALHQRNDAVLAHRDMTARLRYYVPGIGKANAADVVLLLVWVARKAICFL